MTDKMVPIKGYFKIEKIENGEVIDMYEDFNTVMVRVPELLAGQVSGLYTKDVSKYHISAFALGTDGSSLDNVGNDIPKTVKATRTQMFSEENFWNMEARALQGLPTIDDSKQRIYQGTFNIDPRGDKNQNTSVMKQCSVMNEGSTVPYYHPNINPAVAPNINYQPTDYRGISSSDPEDSLTITNSVTGTEIRYQFSLGTFAGNLANNIPVQYNEAAMYMKLGEAKDGNPLGTLFSMKTFPPQFKNNTCALRVVWKLSF